MRHSFSAVNMFENCPQRYYRQRVLADVVDPGGQAADYGTYVHKKLENRLQYGYELPKDLKDCEAFCVALDDLKKKHYMRIHAECELAVDEKLHHIGFDSDKAWIRGILDVFMYNDHLAYVFDWKTGKRRPGSWQLKLCAALVFRNYPEIQKVSTGYIWLKDKRVDREVYTRDQEKEIWKEVLTKVKRIEKAVTVDNWPAIPSGLCRYCPARHDCEFAQV